MAWGQKVSNPSSCKFRAH